MFDQSSGQVFKEWTIPRQPISSQPELHDWSRKRPNRYHKTKARGALGPRSFVDMTTNVIADNIGDVTEAHLKTMPQVLQLRLWNFLEVRGINLHAWKLFSKLLLPDNNGRTLALYRFRHHICQPTHSLKTYIEPLTSTSVEFITHLVISGGCTFSISEMLCLADMRNLGALEITHPTDDRNSAPPQINDRLVRGWSEKENPFPLLRILKVWGNETTSQNSLQWVTKFPSLTLYDVMGDREDWKDPNSVAQKHGWQVSDAPTRLEGSLLRSLMLLAPAAGEISTNNAKSVDADLVSLCSDSRLTVNFVDDGQASPLLNFLTDTAKLNEYAMQAEVPLQEDSACHSAAFESWAFWLYAFMGQLTKDRDLKEQGVHSNRQASIGPFILPSKPMACLYLGHNDRGRIASTPAYVKGGLFKTRRFTFTREACGKTVTAEKPQRVYTETKIAKTKKTGTINRLKRKTLQGLLKTFGGF